MKHFILFCFSFLILSCGPVSSWEYLDLPNSVPVKIFCENECPKNLSKALILWNSALGWEAFKRSNDINSDIIITQLSENEFMSEPCDNGRIDNRACAKIGFKECFITIQKNEPSVAIAHELGHCFGYSHVEDRSNVMAEYPLPEAIVKL